MNAVVIGTALACPDPQPTDAAAHRKTKIATAQRALRNAVKAASGMTEKQWKQEMLQHIGLAQAYAGDLAGADETVHQLSDPEGAADVLSAIALAQAKAGDAAATSVTLRKAMRRIPEVAHARTREQLLLFVIQAHLAAGQFTDAERIAAAFPNPFIRSDARLDIFKAQMAAGRRDEAKATFQKLTAESRQILHPSAWGKICTIYLQFGDVAAALELARAIPKRHSERCEVLCNLAAHEARAGNTAEAAGLFSDAFDSAQQVEVEHLSFRQHYMSMVVKAQAKARHFAGAGQNVARMPDGLSKIEAIGALASAQASAGDRAAARATIAQALTLMGKWESYDRTMGLASIAQAQAEMGERAAAAATANQALELLRTVDRVGRGRAYAVADVAKAIASAGDRVLAGKTLEEGVRRARTEPVPGYRADDARMIAEAQIEMGFRNAAQVTLREVVLPSLPPSNKDFDGLEEATLWAKAGDFTHARQRAGKVVHPSFQAAAMLTVAAYQTMAEGPDRLSAAAKNESDPLVRSALYLGVALGLLRECEIEVRGHNQLSLLDGMPP